MAASSFSRLRFLVFRNSLKENGFASSRSASFSSEIATKTSRVKPQARPKGTRCSLLFPDTTPPKTGNATRVAAQSSALARDMGTSSPSHPTPRFPHLGHRGHTGEDVPALPPGCPSSKGPQAGDHRPPPPLPSSPTPFLLLSPPLASPPPRQPHCGPLSPPITRTPAPPCARWPDPSPGASQTPRRDGRPTPCRPSRLRVDPASFCPRARTHPAGPPHLLWRLQVHSVGPCCGVDSPAPGINLELRVGQREKGGITGALYLQSVCPGLLA